MRLRKTSKRYSRTQVHQMLESEHERTINTAAVTMSAIGGAKTNRWHLQIANRWVVQYNFYIDDRRWRRMYVRISYLPRPRRLRCSQPVTQSRPQGLRYGNDDSRLRRAYQLSNRLSSNGVFVG